MRALPAIAAALAACAAVPPGPPPPAPEQSFRDVKGVALVHRVGWRGAAPAPGETRRRDPLDALQSALAARGLRTVTLELPDRPSPELAAVDDLARAVEWRAQGSAPGAGSPDAGSVGGQAAPVLAQLGVEALAIWTRGPGWGAPPPSPFFGPPVAMAPSPVSAIALVARDGTVIAFGWGGADPFGAPGPVNAAEAIDAALALLAPPPGE